MRYDDAIALLISATNSRNVALRTLRRAEADIKKATEVLCADGGIPVGEQRIHEGYSIVRGRTKGRRYVNNNALLDAWEDLPKKVRDRFDTTFQGTVAELEELMGRNDAEPFLKLSIGHEAILVKEVLQVEDEKPERVDFRG
jgi:hypothetical protein